MRHIDVFNGDADGICALHQLRLADPVRSELVTGLKHEVTLLDRVQAAAGDRVTVLDLSLARNRGALDRLLASGAAVTYFDHHDAGEVPRHPRLRAVLDPTGRRCTSELVDEQLGGRYRPWAVVGAFGDGLVEAAHALAAGLGLEPARLQRLRELGETLNYNGYGRELRDVRVAPLAMYRMVSGYADPFALLEREPVLARLAAERREDLGRAARVPALRSSPGGTVHRLPDLPWSRRVIGAHANLLALEQPGTAHAVLVPLPGGYAVSVRTPAGHATPAVAFCSRFAGGGGRAIAAGIERLPEGQLDDFLARFDAAYGAPPAG